MTTATRLGSLLDPWVEKAILSHPSDVGSVVWETGLTTLPDPARDGQFVSTATVYLQRATGRGDEHIATTVLLSPGFAEESVRDVVHSALDGFRAKLFEIQAVEGVRERGVQPDLANLGKTSS